MDSDQIFRALVLPSKCLQEYPKAGNVESGEPLEGWDGTVMAQKGCALSTRKSSTEPR